MKIWFLSRKILKNSMLVLGMVLVAAAAVQGYFWMMGAKLYPVTAEAEGDPVFQGITGGENVALTINVDWGEEYIPALLELFQKEGVKVTFFVTGTWAEKHPELLQQMLENGHSIQSHGYKHDHYNQMSVEQQMEELAKAEAVISGITHKKCVAFASPYGEFDDTVIKAATQAGYYLIMWTVDSIDWQKPAPEVITDRVLGKIQNDAIVLLHPTENTLQALPDILAGLKEKGYSCMTIEEILQLSPEKEKNLPAADGMQPVLEMTA